MWPASVSILASTKYAPFYSKLISALRRLTPPLFWPPFSPIFHTILCPESTHFSHPLSPRIHPSSRFVILFAKATRSRKTFRANEGDCLVSVFTLINWWGFWVGRTSLSRQTVAAQGICGPSPTVLETVTKIFVKNHIFPSEFCRKEQEIFIFLNF